MENKDKEDKEICEMCGEEIEDGGVYEFRDKYVCVHCISSDADAQYERMRDDGYYVNDKGEVTKNEE